MKTKVVFLFCFLTGVMTHAFIVPALTGPVVDNAHMLSNQDIQEISGLIRDTYEKGVAQIQVVSVESLEGESIEQASIQIADTWKIGDAKKGNTHVDNGLIILIAAQERKMRIEVGQGLEGTIPDVVASRIIRQVMIPNFKNGEPGKGIFQAIVVIRKVLGLETTGSEASDISLDNNLESSPSLFDALLPLLLPFGFFLLLLFLRIMFGSRRWYNGPRGGGGWGGGGFGGGGSFGGGGGWSGGGGGFSGGGASGGW